MRNIKTDLEETGEEHVNEPFGSGWCPFAHSNEAGNEPLGSTEKQRLYGTAERLQDYQEGICSVQLVPFIPVGCRGTLVRDTVSS
jgi:hypothetical protein